MLEEINDEVLLKIGKYFIPSTPITEKKQCYGRYREINTITRSLSEPGKHVLLFGGRGYGKTSVANMVGNNLKNFLIVKINCHRNLSTFSSILKEVIKEIEATLPQEMAERKLKKTYHQVFGDLAELKENNSNLSIHDLIKIFKKIDFPFLVILDEADLISKEPKNLALFADFIKALSDQLPMVKLLIIGIAESSHDFIGEHQSLERCLTEVKIDRMAQNEMADLLDGGLVNIGLNTTNDVKRNILLFAHGLPHYVHLLGFYAAEDALNLKYTTIVEKNFHSAMKQMIENAREHLNKTLKKALGKSQDKLYRQILDIAVLQEEKRLQENYFDNRQDPNYLQHSADLSFTSAELFTLLNQKRHNSYTDINSNRDQERKKVADKVSRILHLYTQSRKGKIFMKENVQGINRYAFVNPLFRAYLHLLMYEQATVSKPVFFVS